MGRGRQKAKATKQARDIKYFSPSTDYSALQRELASANRHASNGYSDRFSEDGDDYEDKYADQFDDEDDDGDPSRRIG
ncbi:DUF3073 domain-containing protein [Arthrobacter monumenti]